MALVPLRYNLRSLWVRRSSTLLTMCAIGATVAVLAFMLSLQQGFVLLFQENGRDDIAVFLRKGATSEGESGITKEQSLLLTKEVPEVVQNEAGQPLASAEMYLAVRRRKADGGETNIALRGVEPMTFAIHGDDVRILEGRNFTPNSDEIVVGEGLIGRVPECSLGEVM
ncbi:MAG: ABC transporter permease, partial [Planctomycetota bacterium]